MVIGFLLGMVFLSSYYCWMVGSFPFVFIPAIALKGGLLEATWDGLKFSRGGPIREAWTH